MVAIGDTIKFSNLAGGGHSSGEVLGIHMTEDNLAFYVIECEVTGNSIYISGHRVSDHFKPLMPRRKLKI